MNFCLGQRFNRTLTTNKKAHGYSVGVSLSCEVNLENLPISVPLEKQKRFYIYMLFNQLSYLSFIAIWFRFHNIVGASCYEWQTLDLQRGCLRTGNARAKIVNLREIQIESQ